MDATTGTTAIYISNRERFGQLFRRFCQWQPPLGDWGTCKIVFWQNWVGTPQPWSLSPIAHATFLRQYVKYNSRNIFSWKLAHVEHIAPIKIGTPVERGTEPCTIWKVGQFITQWLFSDCFYISHFAISLLDFCSNTANGVRFQEEGGEL